jgi:hypothetical protein
VPNEVLNDLETRLKRTRWIEDFANKSRHRIERLTICISYVFPVAYLKMPHEDPHEWVAVGGRPRMRY